MKKFDFYGQFVLAIPALLLALDYNGLGIAFAGLFMLALGVWQLISTLVHMFSKDDTHFNFFRNNFIIAVVYILLVFILSSLHMHYRTENTVIIIMLAIPPFLIVRYWLGIGKIYELWFLKKKEPFELENSSDENL